MVEYQLPKLATGVRFPSLAPNLPKAGLILSDRKIRQKKNFEGSEGPFRLLFTIIIGTILAGCATAPRTSYTAPPSPIKYAVPKDSFAWPVRGYIVSPFGSNVDRVKNKGIDIRSGEGAEVKASRSGRVVYCDSYLKGFGKTVILDHGDGYQTIYSYNSDILVKVGEDVLQNTVIAKAGRSGRAKEPALHFEIRKDGVPQNPAFYLPP